MIMATPRKRRQKLTPDDLFNRESVPQDQIAACVGYEYHREIPECHIANQVVLKLLKQMPMPKPKEIFERPKKKGVTPWNIVLHQINLMDFGGWPEFPGKPWRQVDSLKREEYCSTKEKLETLWGPQTEMRFELVTQDEPPDILASLLMSESRFGRFAISPGVPKRTAKREFNKLLDTIEAETPDFFLKKKGGRGVGIDALIQLSAFRVAKTHKFNNAAGFARGLGWDIKGAYTSASTFNRAVKAAGERITRMSDLIALTTKYLQHLDKSS